MKFGFALGAVLSENRQVMTYVCQSPRGGISYLGLEFVIWWVLDQ